MRVAVVTDSAARVADGMEVLSDQVTDLVLGALQDADHEVVGYVSDPGLGARLAIDNPDVIFNYAHSQRGMYKLSYVPAVADAVGIPCTGSDVLTHATCADKITLKEFARRARIQTPDAWLCNTIHDARHQLSKVTCELVVKPNNYDLGMGVHEHSLCRAQGDAILGVHELLSEGLGPVLVEKFVPGREVHCVVIGSGVDATPLPLVELELAEDLEMFGSETRRAIAAGAPAGGFGPVRRRRPELHPETHTAITSWALALYRMVGVRDLGVVEFIVGQDGVPYFIELNTLPDLARLGPGQVSAVEAAASQEGLPLVSMVRAILDAAVSRYGVADRVEHQIQMGFAMMGGGEVVADGEERCR